MIQLSLYHFNFDSVINWQNTVVAGSPSFIELDAYPMNRENRLLVTDEPVELEKRPVEVGDSRKVTDHFRGICRMYLKLINEKPEDHNM